MQLTLAFISLLLLPPGLASLNGHCTGSEATDSWGTDGICIHTGDCNSSHGGYKTGACPFDENDVKCCLVGLGPSIQQNPCGGSSYCTWTSNSCAGEWRTGYCPGGSNYKCCRTA